MLLLLVVLLLVVLLLRLCRMQIRRLAHRCSTCGIFGVKRRARHEVNIWRVLGEVGERGMVRSSVVKCVWDDPGRGMLSLSRLEWGGGGRRGVESE